MRYYQLILLLILFTGLFSCKGSKEIKDGGLAYELKMYDLAPNLLKEELNKESDPYLRMDKMRMIAESYRYNLEYQKALEWYQKALEEQFDLDILLQIGLTQMNLEDYEAAISTFDRYIEEERFDNYLAKLWKGAAEQALEWKSEFTNVRVNLEEGLSSSQADFAPVLNGNDIVFTSTRTEATGDNSYPWTGGEYGDLFSVARSNKNQSSEISSFSELINTPWYEGTGAFSADGKEIYFTRCGHPNEEKNAYCQIYHSNLDAGEWTQPEQVRLFFDTCNVGQPFLSRDGQTLYYASDSKEGYGGRDIYYSKKLADGSWSTPYSVGRIINTPNDELFPSIDENGILYFSSNGHPGMGGLDLFQAKKSDKGWGSVENLKYPINSGADDFAVAIVKAGPANVNDEVLKSGYFSSNRSGGKGDDDIYFFQYENINTFEVVLRVKEKKYADSTDKDSEVVGLQLLDGVEVAWSVEKGSKDQRQDTSYFSNTGKLVFEAKEESTYRLFAQKEGYINKVVTATTVGKKTTDSIHVKVTVEVVLEKIWPDYSFEIPNIYYDYNEATLRPESFPVLDSLLSFFFENPDITIEIGSHTDSRGSKSYNEELSQRRAQSVVDYLTEQGVNAERLIAKGYGESQLVNRCADGVDCSEEEHQRNRRTTFRIISEEKVIDSSTPDDVRVDPKNE